MGWDKDNAILMNNLQVLQNKAAEIILDILCIHLLQMRLLVWAGLTWSSADYFTVARMFINESMKSRLIVWN